MAFCSNCGTQLEDGAVFCTSCGTRTGGADPVAQAAPPPPAAQDGGFLYETARAKTKAALTKLEAAKAKLEAAKNKAEKVQAKAEIKEAANETEWSVVEETNIIRNLQFVESADGIAKTLNAMFTDITEMKEMLEGASGLLSEKLEEKKDALLDKAEFGIATLQKNDPGIAALFQKKYEKERPKSMVQGMLSMFSKNK